MNFDLEKLVCEDPATLLYVLFRALGKSIRRAAKMAGFSPTTGWRRERSEWWPEALEAMRAALDGMDQPDEPIEELLPQALEVYRDRLAEGDIRAAQDVINRTLGKPGQPILRSGEDGGPVRIQLVLEEPEK